MSHEKQGRSTTIQRLDIEWYAESPIKIGPEGKSPEFDLPVLKINIEGEEVPYLPGTSIKGVLRHAVEQELRATGLKVCDILNPRNSCGGEKSLDIQRYQKGGDSAGLQKLVDNFCISCKIFGSHNYRGRTKILDAYPVKYENATEPAFALGSRPGIAIDRVSGSVAQAALFKAEYVARGSRFKSSIICQDLKVNELALLLRTLLAFNEDQLKIGGLSTKGFGRLRVSVLNSSVRKRSLESEMESNDFPVSDQSTNGTNLTKEIKDWAEKYWIQFIGTRTKKSIKKTRIEPRGKRDYDTWSKDLMVARGSYTPREIIDQSISGIILFGLVPFDGYEVFVGSGDKTIPSGGLGKYKDLIAKCDTFEAAVNALSTISQSAANAYETFSAQVVAGGESIPVIPGSTLKGLFRSRMELAFNPIDGIIDSCFIKEDWRATNPSKVHKRLYGEDGAIQKRGTCSDTSKPCIVCDIFGMSGKGSGLRGLVEIHDAELKRGLVYPVEVEVAPGRTSRLLVVGVSESKTEKKNQPEKQAAFLGSLRFKNLDQSRQGLLLLAMAAYESDGLRIGRFHYRDMSMDPLKFGRMKMLVRSIVYDNGTEYTSKDAIKKVAELKNHTLKEFGERLKAVSESEEDKYD